MTFTTVGFDNAANQELARRRGIIQGDETINDCLNRVHSTIVAIDRRLSGSHDEAFAEDLALTFVNQTALPGTPILASAGRNCSMTSRPS